MNSNGVGRQPELRQVEAAPLRRSRHPGILSDFFLSLSSAVTSAGIPIGALTATILGTCANGFAAAMPFTHIRCGRQSGLASSRRRFLCFHFRSQHVSVKFGLVGNATSVVTALGCFREAHAAHVHRAYPSIFIIPVRCSSSTTHRDPLPVQSPCHIMDCHIWHNYRL